MLEACKYSMISGYIPGLKGVSSAVDAGLTENIHEMAADSFFFCCSDTYMLEDNHSELF